MTNNYITKVQVIKPGKKKSVKKKVAKKKAAKKSKSCK